MKDKARTRPQYDTFRDVNGKKIRVDSKLHCWKTFKIGNLWFQPGSTFRVIIFGTELTTGREACIIRNDTNETMCAIHEEDCVNWVRDDH